MLFASPKRVLPGVALLAALLFGHVGTAAAADPDEWARWGAVPRDTTVRSLDFAGLLFAGSDSDGVFASPTSVGPWTQFNPGLGATGATSVRQVKASPNGTRYAATGAGLFARPVAAMSWTPVGQGTGLYKLNAAVQSILFNNPSGSDMTAAVAGGPGSGIYYSQDSGSTWRRAVGMPAPHNVYHLTSHPAGTPMYAAADDGVWVSGDFGRHWALASDGIPPGETTLRVAVAPDDPSRLFATTSSGVYKFVLATASWVPAEGSEGQTLPAAGGKRALVVTPALNGQFGANRAVVATEQGVWATIDAGAHWGKMSPDTSAPDAATPLGGRVVWSLGVSPADLRLMAGTQGFGVFSLPLQPIEAGTVAVSPATNLDPGTTLNAQVAGWEGSRPYFMRYQWKRCDAVNCTPTTPIPGATGATYVVPNADEAKPNVRYAVTVEGRNLVHPTQVAVTSAPTSTNGVAATPGTNPRPSFIAAQQPSISPSLNEQGTPKWGQTYTINPGSWRTEGNATQVFPAFSYRWQRCNSAGMNCADVPSETGPTLTTTPQDINGKVFGYIRGTVGAQSSDWFAAGSSGTIVNKFPVNQVAPKIVGDVTPGSTLSSAAGGWDGFDMKFERRWLRCAADGSGCLPVSPTTTTSTYLIGAADVGKRLKLEVTAVAADPNQPRRTTAFSAATQVITAVAPPAKPPVVVVPPQPPVAPRIVIKKPARLKVGARLRVPKAYAGFTAPKYRWLRNGTKIRKAKKSFYEIRRRDRGKKLVCRVTLTPSIGGTVIKVKTPAVKIPRRR